MLIISCHADTGFSSHALTHLPGGIVEGHLDNFSGVYSVMKAYFSGRLTTNHLRIELTYGEEKGLIGAYELAKTLKPTDVVLVVDVTGTPTKKDLVVEKCKNPAMQAYLKAAFEGLSYDCYADCPDPISDCDETDAYSPVTPYTCFLGIPCVGGDYNAGMVRCTLKTLDTVAEAICRLNAAFPQFCKQNNLPIK